MTKNQLKELRDIAHAHGLSVMERANGHIQIAGGAILVNWYPDSKKRTAFANGTNAGIHCKGPHQVVKMALGQAEVCHTKTKRKQMPGRRWALIRRDARCHWCLRPLTFFDSTIDHYIPLDKGGSNLPDNTVLACEPCNRARANNLPTLPRRPGHALAPPVLTDED